MELKELEKIIKTSIEKAEKTRSLAKKALSGIQQFPEKLISKSLKLEYNFRWKVTARIPHVIINHSRGIFVNIIESKIEEVTIFMEKDEFGFKIWYKPITKFDENDNGRKTKLFVGKHSSLTGAYEFVLFIENNKEFIDMLLEKIDERIKKSEERLEDMYKKVSKLLTLLKVVF